MIKFRIRNLKIYAKLYFNWYVNKFDSWRIQRQLSRLYIKKPRKWCINKNIISCVILALSFLLFILLYLYCKQTKEESSNLELATIQAITVLEKLPNTKQVESNEAEKVEGIYESTQENVTEKTKLNIEKASIKKYAHKESLSLDNKKYGIVQMIGDVEQKYIDTVEEQVLTLPSALVNYFINEGWELYVTTENIAHVYYNDKYKSVLATTEYNAKRIIIEDREEAVIGSVQHEFGHFLDYLNGKPCWSEEFKRIYIEEVEIFKSNINNSDCVRDEQEFFAETFYYLIMDDSKCTPKAKEFVESILNETISCTQK